jgi:phenylpropionate dioxygenase-like ring-hydroxylating dioxygenase large terminal subunit
MEAARRQDIQRGYGSKERPVMGVLWDRDSAGRTTTMNAAGDVEPNNRQFDYKCYYDAGYFARELEQVWKKQWLFACREEDIPLVGDRVPFNVGPLSYFIVQSEPGEYKAFYNSCLHRGTALCTKAESGATIRCPYHGWEWKVDGRLRMIPSHWDFPELTRLNASLPEVKLERWGGFIFINADPNAGPLDDSLGVLPDHFKGFGLDRRYTKARYRKLLRANWKTTQEAFMESYHLYATHPEGVPFTGDSQSQYDVFSTPSGGAIGRAAVPSAVPSLHASADATPVAAALVFADVMKIWHFPDAPPLLLDANSDIRGQTASWLRACQQNAYGRANLQADTVMLDSILYFMYPHFTVWLSEAVPFVYQFTPHETDPNMSYFDVRLLMPYPEGADRPPSSPAIDVAPDESIFKCVPAFSFLGMIFDQDMSNLPLVQKGMKAADPLHPHTRLGLYQEGIIQYWHTLLDRAVGELAG